MARLTQAEIDAGYRPIPDDQRLCCVDPGHGPGVIQTVADARGWLCWGCATGDNDEGREK